MRAQTLYHRAVADASKIPLIIYNWPQTTGVDIPPDAVVALSEHPNIIAIKESSGNIEKVMQMIREVKPGFQVMVGSAPTLWPSLLMGASGAILAYANAAPYSIIAIWEAYRTPTTPLGSTAEPHRQRRCARHREERHPRPEVRDGPQRLLRRTTPAAAVCPDRRSEEGNRSGVQRSEGITRRRSPRHSSTPSRNVAPKYTTP